VAVFESLHEVSESPIDLESICQSQGPGRADVVAIQTERGIKRKIEEAIVGFLAVSE
jgi:hypothetical protein